MKKKLLILFLLLTALFAVIYIKINKSPNLTHPPVNLAKENLNKLLESYDILSKLYENSQIDFNKSVGYDMTMDISLGKQIKEFLGATGLDFLSLSGTVDINDTISADLGIYLNSSEILHTLLFMDENNIMFNLPKYSSDFAAISVDELLANTDASGTKKLTGNMKSIKSLLHSKELTNIFRIHLTNLIACFKEVDGIGENSSIGTGNYTMTGDKHTVKATSQEVITVLKALEADLKKNYGELDFNLTSLEDSESTAIFLDYYTDKNNNYAWVFYNDTKPADQLVFISTDLGFCLYKTENELAATILTTEKFTKTSGVISLYSMEATFAEGELADPLGTIDYEFDGKTFHSEIILDTAENIIEATIDYSVKNDIITYDMTLVLDGMSFVIKENLSKEQIDLTFTLASYGIEYATVDLDMTLRDYIETTAPTNVVDLETWTSGINQQVMLIDLIQLISKYPFLTRLLEFIK